MRAGDAALARAALAVLASTTLVGCGRHHSDAHPDPHQVLQRLASDSLCTDERAVVRTWCSAARAWQAASPDESLPTTLIGLRARFTGAESPLDAVAHRVKLTAMVAVSGGDAEVPRATLGVLEPDTPAQADELHAVARALEGPLTTGRGTLEIPPQLRAFLASQQSAAHPASRTAHGWEWAGPHAVRLRHVGAWWMTIERDAAGDVEVSLLTDHVR
jgi:hypothetical protein